MTLLEKIGLALAGSIATLLLYTLIIWFPVHMIQEVECLEQGYPEIRTTIGLTGYCINLEGAVTNQVIPLN